METLSYTQQRILRYIQRTLGQRGIAPSVREIGSAVGLSSTSSVQHNLDKLEKMGYIERDPYRKRTIRLSGRSAPVAHVPLLGTVTAGTPILATQDIEEYIPVFGTHPDEELFALHVCGDSMINAHIESGDIVVVERTPVAENGQIVVALIEDEATVKRFYKEDGHFRLQPENDAFAPIIVQELTILGRVKFVIRQYY